VSRAGKQRGLLGRWIEAHGRSDATLGVVEHEFAVKT
jgi:hypothetical protein